MAEDGGDLVAAGALDVHEVGVGVLDQALQLVLALLVLGTRMQKIDGELQGTNSPLKLAKKRWQRGKIWLDAVSYQIEILVS